MHRSRPTIADQPSSRITVSFHRPSQRAVTTGNPAGG